MVTQEIRDGRLVVTESLPAERVESLPVGSTRSTVEIWRGKRQGRWVYLVSRVYPDGKAQNWNPARDRGEALQMAKNLVAALIA